MSKKEKQEQGAETVQNQGKKQRIRRGKKDIILARIQKSYQAKVKPEIYSAELAKISASIDEMEKNIMKKKKPSAQTILELFSADELKELLKQKQEQGN
ncbi:MAG: hypothetical protein IKP65_03540 [Alphaproteobacteria bacterium]|nr:hypothetical protein [Alphaproteobacteria bacterium]